MDQPIIMQWDGDAMVPVGNHWTRRANEQFVVGQRYRMVEEFERSTVSHNHEFAWLKTAWDSLPEDMLEQFPSPEHLRKFALIKTGHCTMEQHPCPTKAEAERLRATVSRYADRYALVVQRENVVTVYTAASQSVRAMGGAQFQKSKTDILNYVAGLLQVDPETLGRQAEAA